MWAYAKKISERVYLLDTYALGIPGTVGAYLLKGPKPALVDCGYASSYESVLRGAAEVGVMPSDVRYVIPTHVHLDHAGAAGRLLKEMPNAEVIAHERAVPHLIDPRKLIESSTMVFGDSTMSLYGLPEPIPAERVTAVGEEARLDLGAGLSATIMHTPGHAPHQVSVLLDGTRSLLTADAVGILYPGLKAMIPTTPPPSFNPQQLVATIGALRQTTPRGLLLPHFGSRDDSDWVFDRTAELVESWVDQVSRMRKLKMSLDQAAESMEKGVASDAGMEDLPIHAKVSVRTSVMGIMHYLDKNS
ncbi:MAG: MBL fold metallo-hydrolase [Nitrososphaerota archaeon]|jgi:glyoxylase-like metal-dependent hydrolase (beta-lactamase superfamily II)|nr:MBL fold metallo-hydrolase [Nitrososphaerota archaeon]MDG6941612.1 MBL fold metallo-hydrolase [Nitrososphaerota archaeon]MDG6947212.1 MBL fold metallo-hydrolase [Nitrososphaerota archaeon]MDG6951208.1 MBL fold metallo-hydrolase [Nitrososphaerota archaeon]